MDNSIEQASYYKLTAFKKAKKMVLTIYSVTKKFPSNEQYSLVPQMRRAAVSVLANLVEGYSKGSTKEYARFIDIAIGSSTELKIFLEISFELEYLNKQQFEENLNLLEEVRKLLYSYKKSLERKLVRQD